MHATLPLHHHHQPSDVLRAAVLALLVLFPFLVKSGFESHAREATAEEYQTSRQKILSSIDSAVRRNDLESLIRIDGKFTPCVKDGVFRTAIREALANVLARETEIELALARHLDLARHGEEISLRPNLLKPQVSNVQVKDIPLSTLPR